MSPVAALSASNARLPCSTKSEPTQPMKSLHAVLVVRKRSMVMIGTFFSWA